MAGVIWGPMPRQTGTEDDILLKPRWLLVLDKIQCILIVYFKMLCEVTYTSV